MTPSNVLAAHLRDSPDFFGPRSMQASQNAWNAYLEVRLLLWNGVYSTLYTVSSGRRCMERSPLVPYRRYQGSSPQPPGATE